MTLNETNLHEIGLSSAEIAEFFAAADRAAQIEILRKKRMRVLDSVHEKERRIQKIDYIIYEIKRNIDFCDREVRK